MKKYLKTIAVAAAALTAATALTACDNGYYDYDYDYGYGSDFIDSGLTGAWELVQVNGRPVSGTASNYLDFYGDGRGMYYYYRNGAPYRERMSYWCSESYSSYSRYQISIDYEYSSPSTMDYWFTDGGDFLWMRWGTGSGPVTYVYRYVSSVPYGW